MIFSIFLILLLIWITRTFNTFMASRQLVDEGWSDIDVQLKRKYDLIPTLIATVKAYAKHEQDIFTTIAYQRTKALTANSVETKSSTDATLNNTVSRLLVIAEGYPTLKANTNYLALQKQLSDTENSIASARRYYNGTVRNFNILISSFPANILATLFHQQKRIFFQHEEDAS
jgi:LemA protein